MPSDNSKTMTGHAFLAFSDDADAANDCLCRRNAQTVDVDADTARKPEAQNKPDWSATTRALAPAEKFICATRPTRSPKQSRQPGGVQAVPQDGTNNGGDSAQTKKDRYVKHPIQYAVDHNECIDLQHVMSDLICQFRHGGADGPPVNNRWWERSDDFDPFGALDAFTADVEALHACLADLDIDNPVGLGSLLRLAAWFGAVSALSSEVDGRPISRGPAVYVLPSWLTDNQSDRGSTVIRPVADLPFPATPEHAKSIASSQGGEEESNMQDADEYCGNYAPLTEDDRWIGDDDLLLNRPNDVIAVLWSDGCLYVVKPGTLETHEGCPFGISFVDANTGAYIEGTYDDIRLKSAYSARGGVCTWGRVPKA
jgi:hypothetical protein